MKEIGKGADDDDLFVGCCRERDGENYYRLKIRIIQARLKAFHERKKSKHPIRSFSLFTIPTFLSSNKHSIINQDLL